MKQDLSPTLKRTSLADAAHTLSYLYSYVDDPETLPSEAEDMSLIEAIEMHCVSVSDSIDRRKYLIKELDAKLEMARRVKKEIDSEIKKYERITKAVINYTINIMESNPDVKFEDSFGRKLKLGESPNPRVILDFETHTKSITHVLSDEDLEYLMMLGMSGYVKCISHNVLDIDMIKRDLKGGTLIPFAKLDDSKVLRGLR